MADYASPYEQLATGLKAVIDAEFEPEGFVAVHDHLHESLGMDRVEIGISPIREPEGNRNAVLQEMYVKVQFYGLYTLEIDPRTSVNPFEVTARAHRFRQATERAQATFESTPEVWFYRVISTDYPLDPSGNKSRFEATVKAYGDNPGLIESR